MAEMTENDLLAQIAEAESDAVAFNGEFMGDNEKLLKQYLGRPYGDEVEGRSRVVSTDISDVVESDMPPLIRSLLNSGPIAKFVPLDPDNEVDVKEAGEKTEFVDWIIRGQQDSYKINYDFIKSVEMYKHGVLKCVFSEEEKAITETFEFIPEDGETELVDKLESIPYLDRFEVIKKKPMEGDKGLFSFEVKIYTKEEKVELLPVPNGTFLISNGASSIESAAMTGDISTQTRGELIASGYDMDIVKQLPR